MHYRMFSSIPDLYPLDPDVMTRSLYRHYQISPRRKSCLPLLMRCTKLEQNQSSPIRKGDACG